MRSEMLTGFDRKLFQWSFRFIGKSREQEISINQTSRKEISGNQFDIQSSTHNDLLPSQSSWFK